MHTVVRNIDQKPQHAAEGTQIANPYRAALRSGVQSFVTLVIVVNSAAAALPSILDQLGTSLNVVFPPVVYVVLNAAVVLTSAIISGVSWVMAQPGVNDWIKKHAPWLAPLSQFTVRFRGPRVEVPGHPFKLGKLPARPGAVKFKLRTYLPELPTVPKVFGHQGVQGDDWGMLGNDQYGDCVFAGAGHETMLWRAESGRPVTFDTKHTLSDYSAVTGFNPDDPDTDQGTDMEVAAKYRRTKGVIDAKGRRHKIAAYVSLDTVDDVATAAYLFGAVGVGVKFPDTAMDQFNAGKPWDVVKNSTVEGGHYIPIVGRLANGNFLAVTWGKLQEVTPKFLQVYMDEAIGYLSTEALKKGKSPEGFDVTQLKADLAAL